MKWQPIRTAPTDRRVLVAWENAVNIGLWDSFNKLWFCAATGKHFKPEQPTHWMELPPAPRYWERVKA